MRETHNPIKEIVSVSEMARLLGLSRARFYQLINSGVFPAPSRNPETKRPYFDREQQAQCLLVRTTHQGANGRPVLFYGQRASREIRPSRAVIKSHRSRKRVAPSSAQDRLIDELKRGLEQLGLTEAAEASIRAALAREFPDGHANIALAQLLMSVFRRMKCQDSPDNVAR